MSPEKAKISDIWTSGAWLEAITALMKGTDGEGGPPILALITNYVESLWVLLASAMGSYDALCCQNAGGGRVSEAPKEAGEPPENFGDTTVLVEEVRRRLVSLRGRFSYENGRRIWILKNNIFFDGVCDGGTWRMALWGYTVGGRVGVVHEVLCNQQIAEYAALEYTMNFISSLGSDRVGLVGDNFSVLQSFAAGKASVGLRVQNRILQRLVYGC